MVRLMLTLTPVVCVLSAVAFSRLLEFYLKVIKNLSSCYIDTTSIILQEEESTSKGDSSDNEDNESKDKYDKPGSMKKMKHELKENEAEQV